MTTTPSGLALNNCFVTVDDLDAALVFYRDVLGLVVHTDAHYGDFRWLTLCPPRQPGLEITLQQLGTGLPMTDADREALGDLLAKGLLSALIFDVVDVDAAYERIRAAGTEVLQEPTDQFYGVRDCAFRDPAGNMVRLKADLPPRS